MIFKEIKKRCSLCKEYKTFNEFGKQTKGKNGLASSCKTCRNIRNKKYEETISGVITRIYANQKSSSKKRGHKGPHYSKSEFSKWILNQGKFHELYENWKKSNYIKDLYPSVDRKNDKKEYFLENLQLMTWKDNREKYFFDKKSGINNSTNKAVIRYDLKMNYIDEYHSTQEASRKTGVSQGNISSVCNGIYKQCNGFIWKFKKCK